MDAYAGLQWAAWTLPAAAWSLPEPLLSLPPYSGGGSHCSWQSGHLSSNRCCCGRAGGLVLVSSGANGSSLTGPGRAMPALPITVSGLKPGAMGQCRRVVVILLHPALSSAGVSNPNGEGASAYFEQCRGGGFGPRGVGLENLHVHSADAQAELAGAERRQPREGAPLSLSASSCSCSVAAPLSSCSCSSLLPLLSSLCARSFIDPTDTTGQSRRDDI